MIDPSKVPYAAWLEETLRNLVLLDPRSICITCLSGEMCCTSYWQADRSDMLEMAQSIQDDAAVEWVRNNASYLRGLLELEDDSGDEENPDEDE